MEIIPTDHQNRNQVNTFIAEHWGGTLMVICGEEVDVAGYPGFTAMEENSVVGVVRYRIQGDLGEIILLHSLVKRSGRGKSMLAEAERAAYRNGCTLMKVVTTNDNIDALRFYQRCGYDLVKVHYNSMDLVRRIKPYVPLVGEYGLPLKSEMELVKALK